MRYGIAVLGIFVVILLNVRTIPLRRHATIKLTATI
jgi:hypothetical protein